MVIDFWSIFEGFEGSKPKNFGTALENAHLGGKQQKPAKNHEKLNYFETTISKWECKTFKERYLDMGM